MVNIADMPRGIDVSKFQGRVNWSAVAASGISFAFARIIDDKTGVSADPQFRANYTGMQSAGILRGAYHFFRPNRNVAAAANLFVSLIGTLEQGDLQPVLDVENNGGGMGASQILDGIGQWIDIVESALNRQVMIYTFTPFWRDTLGNSTRFSDHPLWIAHFTNKPQPNFPSAFPSFSFWQFTESGSCPGVTGNVDLDRFNGSMDGLRAFAGFPPPARAETDEAAAPAEVGALTRGLPAQLQSANRSNGAKKSAAQKSTAAKGAVKKSVASSSKAVTASAKADKSSTTRPGKSKKAAAKKPAAKKAGPKGAKTSAGKSTKKSAAKKTGAAKKAARGGAKKSAAKKGGGSKRGRK